MVVDSAAPTAPEVPDLAPPSPHRRLAEDLVALGFRQNVAEVVGRAAVHPSDARKRLASPDIQRTSQGDILSVAIPVWSPLICAHPDNKREAAFRDLPIAGLPLRYPSLSEVGSKGMEPWVSLQAASVDQLVYSLRSSESFLVKRNPLWEQIGEEGVLRPITVVGLSVEFSDPDVPPIALAVSADGSSRISSAHKNLGITALDVVRFASDDRTWRNWLGAILSKRENRNLAEADFRALRSLIVPADVVIRVEPRDGLATTTARAVRSLVGLMHVQPPKEWTPAAKLDAQADEVLEELASQGVISSEEHEYLAGRMTLDEAEARGLPRHADERAAMIIRLFASNDAAVKQAIRRVTHAIRVHKGPKANVAVELAIRSYRRNAAEAEADIHTSRVGFQLAARLKEFWEGDWEVTLRSPEELRDGALAELGGDQLGPSQIELALLGAFELARVRNLVQFSLTREALKEGDQNLGSPAAILRRMIGSRLGIYTLYQAVAKGRLGAARFPRVNDLGLEVYTADGEPTYLSAKWVRDTFRADRVSPEEPDQDVTPETEYRNRQDGIRSTIHSLRAQLTVLASLQDDTGAEMVRTLGWRPEEALPLVRELNAVTRLLHTYVTAYRISTGQRLATDDDLTMADEVDEDDAWS